jgi:hypothetical protein
MDYSPVCCGCSLTVKPLPSKQVSGVRFPAAAPLYKSGLGTKAAPKNLLALVDALRIGRARERGLAEKEINRRLDLHVAD